MAYGLKYQTQFRGVDDPITGSRGLYTLQFLFKDYAGNASTLTGGQTTVIQKCVTDDPFAPIKGTGLDIALLNFGNLPITSFYSEDDDGVMVKLIAEDLTVLFVGFIVQDDIFEPMVDFVHNISLTATDGLGLLKGVPLNKAINPFLDLIGKNLLSDIMRDCLAVTNLELNTNIFCNVWEVNQSTTGVLFVQTMIDTQAFLQSETYDDCYNVLSKLLETFRCSLFQSNGEWNIVHWDEVRQYPALDIPGFQYDSSFALNGPVTFGNIFIIGQTPEKTRPIFGIQKGTFRGLKFVRKQFDYQQPKYLFRNYDLTKVGALLATYTSGGLTYFEYEAPDFQNGFASNNIQRFIRVVRDTLFTEVERYLVLKGQPSDTPRAVQAMPIEVSQTDKVVLSYSFRTTVTPVTVMNFALREYDGTNNRYAHEDGSWQPGLGFAYNTNGSDWQAVIIEPTGVPFDGLLYPYFGQVCPTPNAPSDETHYKDIRFQYIPYIADTYKIIGQVHKDEQTPNIKANSDVRITIDDSPKNSIQGTLFLNSTTGLLKDRTLQWKYLTSATLYRLGQLTAREELLWRETTRTKVNGSFVGIYQTAFVSLLCLLKTTYDPTKVYTFGQYSIDYKNNQFSGTLWELIDTAEPVLADTYTFNYIYDAK